jgi:regulatory protein
MAQPIGGDTAPLDVAIRALRHRDRSAAEVAARLEQRGVAEPEREQALEALARMGYVDDERFARTRAEQLAGRGAGNALIRDDLARRHVPPELVDAALDALEPERARAERIADRRGRTVKTARYLASKGFDAESLTAVVAAED